MSSAERQRKLVLSPSARQDFIDILRAAGQMWGQGELQIYRDRMNDALQAIGRKPALGRPARDLSEEHRLYLVHGHVIVYREQESAISVVRILPQRRS